MFETVGGHGCVAFIEVWTSGDGVVFIEEETFV